MTTTHTRFMPAFLSLAITLVLALAAAQPARATVFDLPAFIEPGTWSIGVEPEIDISNGTGAAINVKPRFGISDLLNIEGLIGTGAGARDFRAGGTADFDWFPDFENQPGIATPLFFEYYRYQGNAQILFGAKPMVYKTFKGKDAQYTPFIAVPLGWAEQSSNFTGIVQIAIGSMFKLPNVDKWRFSAEAGFNAANAYSYISGGATYYF